jgi:CRP-like cAMP-binding protein
MVDKQSVLQTVPLFAGFGPRELGEIGSLTDEVDVPAGRTLITQGATAEEFFIILDGQVRIERDGVRIRELGAGDFLGEIGLVDARPRTSTVITVTDCKLLVLAHREFNTLMVRYPEVQAAVLQALALRIRRLEPDEA